MLWDESFQSWAQLGVSLQPSAMLFTPDGQLIKKWLGPIPESDVLALSAGSRSPDDPQVGSQSFCRYADRYVAAHDAFEAYTDVPVGGQQRVLDDIRFASNAMAQTAPQDILDEVESLAGVNRALVALIVDADYTIDAADDTERSALLEQLNEALIALSDPVLDGCGVELPAAGHD